jgi:multimeric flavodoxin WrbA
MIFRGNQLREKGIRMEDLKVKILGIVGTPIKNGNCQYQLEEALKAAEATGRVVTELVYLGDYQVSYCIGCDRCMRKINKVQKEVGFHVLPVPIEGYNCSIKDGMEELHQKMLEADGILLMAPVYIASIPGQVKTFIDRCRTFVHDFRLLDKVAAPMTIGFFRNSGQDTALDLMRTSLLALGLNVVSYGSSSVSTREGIGIPIKETRFAVKEDLAGALMVDIAVKKLVRTALHIKAGKLALAEKE